MLVMVTKLKGGSGATTITREVATYAAKNGWSVAVIDLDGQGTLTNWWNRRAESLPHVSLLQMDIQEIPQKTAGLRSKYDLVLIDTPPSVHTALGQLSAVMDQVIIPTRPTPDDLDTIGAVLRSITSNDHIKRSFVLTAVAGKRSVDAAQAENLLATRGQVLGKTTNRTAYFRGAYEGKAGNEIDKTADSEIAVIAKSILPTGKTKNVSTKKQTVTRNGNAGHGGNKTRSGKTTQKVSRTTAKK